jgi:hypothetical protein
LKLIDALLPISARIENYLNLIKLFNNVTRDAVNTTGSTINLSKGNINTLNY